MDKNTKKIDILDRQQFVDKVKDVIRLLSENKRNVTFAINGQWGVGKTFVLNMLEEQLKDDYIVFHFNAWEYDYYDEPLVALLTSTVEQLKAFETDEKTAKQIGKAVLKTAAKSLIKIVGEISKNKLGVDIPEMAQDIYNDVKGQQEEDTAYDTYLDITKKIEEVKEQLQKLSEIKTVVFVVDELDRCLPEYAIKVLERLHHVFTGVDNLQVILSVDKKQLDNTIKTIFGNDINIKSYLQKFINFDMDLTEGIVNVEKWEEKYSEYYSRFEINGDYNNKSDVAEFVQSILSFYSPRKQDAIMRKALLIHDLLLDKCKLYQSSYMCLELLIVVGQMENMFDDDRIKTMHSSLDLFADIKRLSFMDKKIKEPDKREISGGARYIYNDYGHLVTVKLYDLWGLLWLSICGLFGEHITNTTNYIDNVWGVKVGIVPDSNRKNEILNQLIEHAKKYLLMCASIQ